MGKATLRDVAQQAGVSLGTASQALNNKPGVAPETRSRVLEAAAALGYQHTVRVASPRSLPVSTVGVLIKRMVDDSPVINPFYSYVLGGAERECRRLGLTLMYANIEVDRHNRASGWPPMLLDQRVDGLLIVGTFVESLIGQIDRQAGKPVVLVDAYAAEQAYDSVLIDNVNGAYSAVNHLITQRHRHIGIIGSEGEGYPSIQERRNGYVRALQDNGLEAAAYIEDSPLTREGAYDATLRLLARAPEVTAIFGCNDNVAIGVMNAAVAMGRIVPEDLSVVGFDDIDLAQEVSPSLTTMHVDKVLMGVQAVRHLHDRAEMPERSALTTLVSAQLIVRDSVCPPAPR